MMKSKVKSTNNFLKKSPTGKNGLDEITFGGLPAGGGRRIRGLLVLKSRGMAHSNVVREFRFSGNGIELHDFHENSKEDFLKEV